MSSSRGGGNERKRNRWGERPSAAAAIADRHQIFQPPSTGILSRSLPPYPTSPSNSMFLRGPPPHLNHPSSLFSRQPAAANTNRRLPPPPPPPPPPHQNHISQNLASRWAPPPPPPPPRIPPPPPPRNGATVASSSSGSVITQLKAKLEQTKQYTPNNATNCHANNDPDNTHTTNSSSMSNASDMEVSDDETAQNDEHEVAPEQSPIKQDSLQAFQGTISGKSPSSPVVSPANEVKAAPLTGPEIATSRLDRPSTLRSSDAIKSPPLESQQAGTTDRATRLRLAKEKLRNAQAKLVTALKDKDKKKRKRSSTPISDLPPISAISQNLIIRDFSGPAHLVEFLPDVKLLQAGTLDIVPPSCSDDEDESVVQEKVLPTINLQQKGQALRMNLLLLKKKRLALTLKKQQQRASPINAPVSKDGTVSFSLPDNQEKNAARPTLTKEALKKRQEELQQTVDTAYWKRLIQKHRNLLAASQEKLEQHEVALQACRNQMAVAKADIVVCRRSLAETTVREECLADMISRATQRVLVARKKRYEATNKKQRGEQQRADVKKDSSLAVDVDLT